MNSVSLHILLIEDNPADADFLIDLLSEASVLEHTIHQVDYLATGLSYLQQHVPDIVLSDLSLPDATGLEAVIQLHQTNPDLPIVVLTGLADEETGLAALREGAQDYLVKGQIDENLLSRTIRYAIERSRTQQVIQQQSAEIAQSNAQFRRVFEAGPIGMALVKLPDKAYEQVNAKFCELADYSEVEMLSKSYLDLLHPEDLAQFQNIHSQLINREVETIFYECRLMNRAQVPVWVHLTASLVVDESGNVLREVQMIQDIRDRKQAEADLKASLTQKELLLKEVHHRVKNNLQVISSIFSMQSRLTEDEELLGVLQDSHSRIQSMALIHETLYQSTDLSQVSLGSYVQSLFSQLVDTNRSRGTIRFSAEMNNIALPLDTAIPFGLLLNELISNALKHGFPDRRSGQVSVTLSPLLEQRLQLVVQDNGMGLPPDLNIHTAKSLGMRLINALTRQIDGTLEAENRNGAIIRITFPEPRERQRF